VNAFILNKVRKIQKLNPDKIYVENIRSLLHIPTILAKTICEWAVKDKLFIRKTGIVCPNCKRIIKSYNNPDKHLDESVECLVCESEERDFIFKTSSLEKIIFYRLNNDKSN